MNNLPCPIRARAREYWSHAAEEIGQAVLDGVVGLTDCAADAEDEEVRQACQTAATLLARVRRMIDEGEPAALASDESEALADVA